MIQSISGPVYGAEPQTATGVGAAPEVQRPDSETLGRSGRPAMDEYIPEEKQEPSGRYWLGKDEAGQPKVYFDDPEAKASDGPNRKAPDGKKAETCTGSTDKVDREIERLKKEKEQLEQQLNSETDEGKKQELKAKLTKVENELRQKDNDAYRRQHMVVS